MKRIFLIIVIGLSTLSVFPSTYHADSISEELKKNACAVVRNYSLEFTIESTKSGKSIEKLAITILNKNGEKYAILKEFYDSFRKINNISAVIYDKNGDIIKKVKQNEIKDYSAISGYSLYEDNRVKYIKPLVNSYPYTVEYEVERKYKGLFYFPGWYPVSGYEVSVINAKFQVNVPDTMELRHYENFISNKPVISYENNNKIYRSEVNNIKAIKYEPYSKGMSEAIPYVVIAPNDFEIDGYSGNMESWEMLGKWQLKLLNGLQELTISTKSEIDKLMEAENTDLEKIKALYLYVQNKTRYVSIQEGIGGWKPFPALDVDNLGYGDCKALSNYTMSLLKYAGFESYYTKVRAGSNARNLIKDFPSNQSNHIILCVPVENDTIWLECTDQEQPFGYLGKFTDDRDVLIVTEDGGKIAHTTVYTQDQNIQFTSANVTLDPLGNAKCTFTTKFSGIQYDNLSYLLRKGKEEQEKALYKDIELTNFTIEEFSFDDRKDIIPKLDLSIELDIQNYLVKSSSRMFLTLNLLNKSDNIPKELDERKQSIHFRRAYYDSDTIIYQIPDGYQVEYIPDNISIENQFGSYTMEVTNQDNKITYIRQRKYNKGDFPASDYEELRKYYKKITKADKQKAILIKSS